MVTQAEMVRLDKGDDGTFGVLRLDGKVFCVTLEPPDRDNLIDISCIPTGEYVCRKVKSPGFGVTFEIVGVPNRTHILFHAGNVPDDTRGCVLLGRYYGVLGQDRAVLQSGSAFSEFLTHCSDVESFQLRIVEKYEEE